ncbi:MAG: twin-arginine translocase TatA/TatE family subunit [Fimbriimonadaceae bacterium]|jgi:sec-independent protein translocase protein TatA|nr:twin-arginine translocase TatA/TatE family subunit [Fimbriimonadaceae bacterium]
MTSTLAFLQGPELILILVLVVLVFGGTQIPKLMKGLGKGVGELKKGIDESKQIIDEAKKEVTKDG